MLIKCKSCEIEKPVIDFGKDNSKSDGISIYCKICVRLKSKEYKSKNRKKVLAKKKIYNDNNGYVIRLKARYNLTIDDYKKMVIKQNNRCYICGNLDTRKLCVDHNHITGEVRALLCYRCNISLGLINESVETLQSMVEYIKKYNQ